MKRNPIRRATAIVVAVVAGAAGFAAVARARTGEPTEQNPVKFASDNMAAAKAWYEATGAPEAMAAYEESSALYAASSSAAPRATAEQNGPSKAEVQARQQLYLQAWAEQDAAWRSLPAEEYEARRAELKRSIMDR